jgi:hypothetical protein
MKINERKKKEEKERKKGKKFVYADSLSFYFISI